MQLQIAKRVPDLDNRVYKMQNGRPKSRVGCAFRRTDSRNEKSRLQIAKWTLDMESRICKLQNGMLMSLSAKAYCKTGFQSKSPQLNIVQPFSDREILPVIDAISNTRNLIC